MIARQPQARGSTRAALAALLMVLLSCTLAAAQGALTGDVNQDGEINILDVQGSINIALGAEDPVPEADVDASTTVDVRDVQTIINTALGVGGLVQPVHGQVALGAGQPVPATVIAVSSDGRAVQGSVNPATGEFQLILGVGTAWSFGLANADGVALAALRFPAEQYASATLPLLQLASGTPIELGTLPPTGEILTAIDVRTIIGEAVEPLDLGDYDGNGLPDVLDALVFPLPVEVPAIGFELPPELTDVALIQELLLCLDSAWAEPPAPTLEGAEDNGVPNFVEPMLVCIENAMTAWLNEDSLGIPDFIVEFYVDFAMELLRQELPVWLGELNRLDLEDGNGNFLPDYLETALCIPGLFGPCYVDDNSNGIGDFLEDSDGDGVADIFDPDAATEDDLDGDGVPNDQDLDDDGDGVLDYADSAPGDPNIG